MPATLSPREFVERWRHVALNERAAYQQHFIELCRLAGHPTPVEMDPKGLSFRFEAGAGKVSGGDGFADVWYKGHFAWEYKGRHADLKKAYQQLLQYREDLENPPLLIVSDTERIEIHTNFTNTPCKVITLQLNDLLTTPGMERLRAIFFEAEFFRVEQTVAEVTTKAAARFAQLAEILRAAGNDPHQVAHFLIRLVFCLFAEDIDLLPRGLFTDLAKNFRNQPAYFTHQLSHLFEAMAEGGGFGTAPVPKFDGWLFDDAAVLELNRDGLEILIEVSGLNWAYIDPSIFGTLFERSLDPGKRSQLGAHYTSREDILLIVEPVLMAPLRRRWGEIQAQALALKAERDAAAVSPAGLSARKQAALNEQITALLDDFSGQLAAIQVLDPACGSGNFLYLALRQLLDLWKAVNNFGGELGLNRALALFAPGPAQLHGIEINEYAQQLAQAAIWIGYIQWLRENGYEYHGEPVLQKLDNILNMDAILAYDAQGHPCEPEWPPADVIIGNPPFLGGSKIRSELGREYQEALFSIYDQRLPACDLVCYWFEKARALIETGRTKRVGLLATQAIRGGSNRQVLQRIKETGDMFWAQSDREWILDGAAVRVSMIAFDNGSEGNKAIDGIEVKQINSDLTASLDLTSVLPLHENQGIAFVGSQKIGPFDISMDLAQQMLQAKGNPNGRPNNDVVKPSVNGSDIMGIQRNNWIIDFGPNMPEQDASLYEMPFEYVKKHVLPERKNNNRASYAQKWWIHGEARPGMRIALRGLRRFFVTSRVARHRVFVWLTPPALPDHKLAVFARDDDYFFGVLQSKFHTVWSLRMGGRHGVGNDPVYSVGTCFETFPFPWTPGSEPQDDPRVQAIAAAAAGLVRLRDNWLNPPEAGPELLKGRTLTNLYNARPTWLDNAHRKLDAAVCAAYGWPDNLSDEEILARLLALNLERAGQ